MNLENQAAIVTGGASGLGEATARALHGAGAKVTLFDMDQEKGPAVADDIHGLYQAVDVRDEQSVTAALDAAEAAHGPARILVNCAGVGTAAKTAGSKGPHDYEAFRRVLEVNLFGTFNCIRLATHRMLSLEPLEDNERGVVVNTLSVAAYEGQIGQVAYAASKGGIASMTLPMARDLCKSGIRVCGIAPGLFLTPMLYRVSDDIRAELASNIPFPHRLGNPEEFAELALHICTNKMLNGENIRLDGALRMAPK